MAIWSERDIEQLLRSGVKPDPGHKEALRARLVHGQVQLGLDELENVTGGVTQESLWNFERWPDEHGVWPGKQERER